MKSLRPPPDLTFEERKKRRISRFTSSNSVDEHQSRNLSPQQLHRDRPNHSSQPSIAKVSNDIGLVSIQSAINEATNSESSLRSKSYELSSINPSERPNSISPSAIWLKQYSSEYWKPLPKRHRRNRLSFGVDVDYDEGSVISTRISDDIMDVSGYQSIEMSL
eukprot:CAMPEP_0182428242 /NCGR_PEP_ID=MMETSP1167-20130531/21725_1 /TAXON_ID=2988 /ORGANISM="Mallomonas Sp, Strain CCMP3275" /LENGTH=162 /DNA_ID=CAMNT_0024611005 /DNA_START=62 /DNA_END=550 /DNA_ORIENTATION=+